jgi:hypothetical protein
MLTTVVTVKSIFDNIAFDLVAGALLAVAGFEGRTVPERYRTWKAARRLMKGEEEVPGFTATKPLGTRLLTLEVGQKKQGHDIEDIKTTLGEQNVKLDYVVSELSTNGGTSTKDAAKAAAAGVLTSNGQTVGELLDANEGRRVESNIDHRDRTIKEQSYVDKLGKSNPEE